MPPIYDVVIVGAGPAGLAAAVNAQLSGLNYLLLEKESHFADTTRGYQKGKHVMSEPAQIPLRGGLWLQPGSRETVLERWEELVRKHGLKLALNQSVRQVIRAGDGFRVVTATDTFEASRVVLALGTQGNPRKLDVPGEELPHVLKRLDDPQKFSGRNIVVVGGGDSAIEIATALAPRNRVTLVVRTLEFIRAKETLERSALELAKKQQLTIHFSSVVERVKPDSIVLKNGAGTMEVKADVVIVKIGTLPQRSFLQQCGVGFSSSDADAVPVINSNYETQVRGLFVIGAASGRGDLIKLVINQGYEVVEHICGRDFEPVDEALLSERLAFLSGAVSERIRRLKTQAPLIASATEQQIRELLLSSNFHRLPAGKIVFRQHDYSESLYLILEGTLEVLSHRDDAAPDTVLATLRPGEFFGEMSLISGRRRSATIRAATPAFLWEVSRKATLKFIHMTPAAKALVDDTFLVHAFQSSVFANLEHALLKNLAARARLRVFHRGDVIVREGEEGSKFFFIRSGMVKVFKQQSGREIVLAYLSAGQYFGEMAVLSGKPRIASVGAIDRVEVIELAREDFLECVGAAPELRKRFDEEADRRHLRNIELEVRPELAELGRFMIREEVVVGDNVLLIDENRCIQCDQCVTACESVHDDGQSRIKRTGIKFANVLVANSCRHCENPLCMTDCPPGDAIVRDPHGEVYIRDNCIGCGRCAANCPYDNIFMVDPEPDHSIWDWLKRALRLAPEHAEAPSSFPVKCDLCRDIPSGPACVRSCPTGAVLRLTPAEYNRKIEALALERKESL